jgi:hypothetical protein
LAGADAVVRIGTVFIRKRRVSLKGGVLERGYPLLGDSCQWGAVRPTRWRAVGLCRDVL